MTIKVFPWADVGQVNTLNIVDKAHVVDHPYGAGYHASRAEASKIQKEYRLGWKAMTETQWLIFLRFWRSVFGSADAFHMEYPIVVAGWDIGANPSAALADPEDGFDLEIDDSTVDSSKPVFLVNFVSNSLNQKLIDNVLTDRRFMVTVSVREVS